MFANQANNKTRHVRQPASEIHVCISHKQMTRYNPIVISNITTYMHLLLLDWRKIYTIERLEDKRIEIGAEHILLN